jgi:DNA polymerase-3 subunit gamma/tau
MRRVLEEKAVAETTEPIHVKYRPRRLEDVLGQKAVVKSLAAALKAKARPHAFLFTGPAGTGKTTLARIVTSECGCTPSELIEVDAASNSGIDDMRAVTAALRYNGFGESPNKGIIIDECHGLSKQAWDSLLKSVEEPPAHVYFVFCSTNPGKIPEAIVTRCSAYHLAAVKFNDLMDLLEDICDREGYGTKSSVLQMVAQACDGSPRKALTMLANVHDCSADEAETLLQQPLDNKEVIDLCRLLVKGDLEWPKLCATLKALGDVPAESTRIIIVNYLNACLMGARNDRDAVRLLDMLNCFLKPCNPSDKLGPLLVAFGRFIFP